MLIADKCKVLLLIIRFPTEDIIIMVFIIKNSQSQPRAELQRRFTIRLYKGTSNDNIEKQAYIRM